MRVVVTQRGGVGRREGGATREESPGGVAAVGIPDDEGEAAQVRHAKAEGPGGCKSRPAKSSRPGGYPCGGGRQAGEG